ncbi:MAG: hypothetical protein ACREBF_02155 [Candidatus Micrarchaeales archaeon]
MQAKKSISDKTIELPNHLEVRKMTQKEMYQVKKIKRTIEDLTGFSGLLEKRGWTFVFNLTPISDEESKTFAHIELKKVIEFFSQTTALVPNKTPEIRINSLDKHEGNSMPSVIVGGNFNHKAPQEIVLQRNLTQTKTKKSVVHEYMHFVVNDLQINRYRTELEEMVKDGQNSTEFLVHLQNYAHIYLERATSEAGAMLLSAMYLSQGTGNFWDEIFFGHARDTESLQTIAECIFHFSEGSIVDYIMGYYENLLSTEANDLKDSISVAVKKWNMFPYLIGIAQILAVGYTESSHPNSKTLDKILEILGGPQKEAEQRLEYYASEFITKFHLERTTY